MYVCHRHGGRLAAVKRAAARRQWMAYASLAGYALEEARELLTSTRLRPETRARLAASVLEFAAHGPSWGQDGAPETIVGRERTPARRSYIRQYREDHSDGAGERQDAPGEGGGEDRGPGGEGD